jgi:hypothetical protein
MRLNIDLNVELGIRIFSFPMRYQPTDRKDRTYVGEKWNRFFLRSMQIILQATHGVVSGAPEFFSCAFGSTEAEFESLLTRPHHFIFNRAWYETYGGKEEFSQFRSQFADLNAAEKQELQLLLSVFENRHFSQIVSGIHNPKVAAIFQFYKPLSDRQEREIWEEQRRLQGRQQLYSVPDDERVEDAGLELEPQLAN